MAHDWLGRTIYHYALLWLFCQVRDTNLSYEIRNFWSTPSRRPQPRPRLSVQAVYHFWVRSMFALVCKMLLIIIINISHISVIDSSWLGWVFFWGAILRVQVDIFVVIYGEEEDTNTNRINYIFIKYYTMAKERLRLWFSIKVRCVVRLIKLNKTHRSGSSQWSCVIYCDFD